jgi:hypothetical protein
MERVNVSTKPIVVYISHSAGDDIEPIRDYLGGQGCVVRDSYDLSAPEDIGDAIRFGISQADFVIVHIDACRPNVFFELGVAAGLGKPMLLLVEPGAAPPAFVADTPYLISDLRNSEVLRLALDRFLKSAEHAPAPPSVALGIERSKEPDGGSIESIVRQIEVVRHLPDPRIVEGFRSRSFPSCAGDRRSGD